MVKKREKRNKLPCGTLRVQRNRLDIRGRGGGRKEKK